MPNSHKCGSNLFRAWKNIKYLIRKQTHLLQIMFFCSFKCQFATRYTGKGPAQAGSKPRIGRETDTITPWKWRKRASQEKGKERTLKGFTADACTCERSQDTVLAAGTVLLWVFSKRLYMHYYSLLPSPSQ